MKRLLLMFIVMSIYTGFISCSPEGLVDETAKVAEDCCGDEGNIPPPPPPPPSGD